MGAEAKEEVAEREMQAQEVTEGMLGSTRVKGQRTQGGLEEAAASWAAGPQGRQSHACGGVELDNLCPSECSSELTHLGKWGQLPPSSHRCVLRRAA